ncbi:MAG: rhomboid family intramembrane serine protease [Myxococcales bacterium]|nr:rhomboid family intramembrane serine protease [Myxococcales bacterium]
MSDSPNTVEQLTEVARTPWPRVAEELGFVLSSVGIEPTVARVADGQLVIAVPDEQLARAREVVAEELAEQAARREREQRARSGEQPAERLPTNKVPLYWLVALLVANVCAFIALEGSGGSTNTKTLLALGASHTPALPAQWWRTVTAVFLHIGALHLLANSLSLVVFGAFALQTWGKGRFYVIYLLSGAIGNWVSFAVAGSGAVKAGASGAILGILGGLAGDRIRAGIAGEDRRYKTWHVLAMLVAYYGFAVGTSGRVDHAAHLGGLAAGAALALMLPRYDPTTSRGRRVDLAMTIGSAALAAIAWTFCLLARG